MSQTISVTFRNEFPNEEVPTRQIMFPLAKKLAEADSIEDASRNSRPITVEMEETRQRVSRTILSNL